MPELTNFPNYAGKGEADGIDDILDAELRAAGIEPCPRFEGLRGRIGSEIETVSCGQVGPWFFQRYWYYWVAKGPGIPPEDAERLHATHGTQCRVDGHCMHPSPLEWFKGFAVGHYHIDTAEGLKALADTIKTIMARTAAAEAGEEATNA